MSKGYLDDRKEQTSKTIIWTIACLRVEQGCHDWSGNDRVRSL